MQTYRKRLTYEDIEKLTKEELVKEKIQSQINIINIKEKLENPDLDYDEETYLQRKLAHLKRLALRMDLKLAEYNATKSINNLEDIDKDSPQFQSVLRHLEIVQLLKPDTKYAMFYRVCHEMLDVETCRMLSQETMNRLTELKTEVRQRYPKLKDSYNGDVN